MPNKNTLIMGGSAVAIAIAVGGLLYNAFVYQARKPAIVGKDAPAAASTDAPGKTAALPGSAASSSAPAGSQGNPAPVPGKAPAAATSGPNAPSPAFDIVRVEPSGEAVVAGRTEPGASVELLNRGQPVGKATADPNGQFVIIPGSLQPGAHQLQLRMTAKDKQTVSQQAVSVSVPEKGGKDVIVALSEPDKPTVILSDTKTPVAERGKVPSAPEPAKTQVASVPRPVPSPDAASPSQVGIRIVEAEQKGGFYASGMAEAGAKLGVYLNGAHVADVQADRNGQWSLRVERGMSPGNYDVRVDVIDPATGKVRARAQVPFNYPARVAAAPLPAEKPATPGTAPAATPAVTPSAEPAKTSGQAPSQSPQPASAGQPATAGQRAPAAVSGASSPTANAGQAAAILPPPEAPAHVVIERLETASVVKGDSLWRISRTMLGRGIRYTQIYEANTDQIRNPNRIYPGQVLVVPVGKAGQTP